jgi:hypothetical protein
MEQTINELEVNGKTYVLKGSTKSNVDSPVKIAILQRGWIFVGRFKKVGSDCSLENAHCIRQWGTTKGIGELVDGPTSKTVLDKCDTVRFHEMTIVALLDASESGWKKQC